LLDSPVPPSTPADPDGPSAAPCHHSSPGRDPHSLSRRGRRASWARVLVCVVGLAPLSTPALGAASPASAAPAVAPPIDLPTRTGTITPADLAGKFVYVDFWASWCGPCKLSFPWLKTLHEKYAAKGLLIVAINLDKTQGEANRFLANFSTPFLIAFDPAGKTAEAFQVEGMPSSFLVNPGGAIVFSHAGFDLKEAARIESVIQEALTR
jgi:cytochrome c biogenesis protein CcmG/thiol:disulfide interchange protein DsbE